MLDLLEEKLVTIVRQLSVSDSAHDLAHVKRVVKNARQLAITENANLDIVIPAAWLHDVVSLAKNDPNRAMASQLAADKACELLTALRYPEYNLSAVHHAIKAHSFSAGVKALSIEAQIVQDADRLDALGAIGLARCFMVSGALNRPLYHRQDPFAENRSLDDSQFCVDHFYQKLFTLTAKMNTASAREIAAQRSAYMRDFVEHLASEIV
jgi:uncharacterized protein